MSNTEGEHEQDRERAHCLRCKRWHRDEHLCQTIDDGRRYYVTVVEQGNEALDHRGGSADADEVGPERSLSVRAWSLGEAMETASEQRDGLWEQEDEEER